MFIKSKKQTVDAYVYVSVRVCAQMCASPAEARRGHLTPCNSSSRWVCVAQEGRWEPKLSVLLHRGTSPASPRLLKEISVL